MSRIFISYKRADKEKVFKIKDQIESVLGEKCWIDLDGIESDAQFANVIIKAINECEVFLFMYSSAHSRITDYKNDWTVRELDFAQHKKKRIVFVNLDNSPLSDWFYLLFGTIQQVDAMSGQSLSRLMSDLKEWFNIKYDASSPTFPEPSDFCMVVEDVFIISRGAVVTGRIQTGCVKVNNNLILKGVGDERTVKVVGIERERKLWDEGKKGEAVGLLLEGVKKSEVKKGMVLLKQKDRKMEVVAQSVPTLQNISRESKSKIGTAAIKYKITIKDAGPAKLSLIKLIKELHGWSLREAKDFVDSIPATTPMDYDKDKATSVLQMMKEVGAIADVVSFT